VLSMLKPILSKVTWFSMTALWALLPLPSQAMPICINDLCFDVPTAGDREYYVKAADFTGDGLVDLYVTGGYKRVVQDFIVAQQPGLQFSVLNAPTESQRQSAAGLSRTPVDVFRFDVTGDGILDFWLENIDEVIDDAPGLLITTTRGTGARPERIIKNDEEFEGLVDALETLFENVEDYQFVYNNTFCDYVYVWVPVYDPTNSYGYGPKSPYNEFWGEGPGFYESGYQVGQYSYVPTLYGYGCFRGKDFFNARGQATLDAFNRLRATTAEPPFSPASYEKIFGKIGDPRRVRDIAKEASLIKRARTAKRFYRWGALVLATILVLDDSTGIGVSDDAFIVPLLATAGRLALEEIALNTLLANLEKEPDLVAVAEPDPDTSVGQPEPDPYRIRDTCMPNDPALVQKVGKPGGSARVLRGNMNLAGCTCETGQGNAAHHIVLKKGPKGQDGGKVGDALRACLKRSGIDIDSAANGACLPNTAGQKTKACRHGSESMHSRAYTRKLLDECLAAEQPGGRGMSAVLDEARQKLSTCDRFW
jgi:hypothetical protein